MDAQDQIGGTPPILWRKRKNYTVQVMNYSTFAVKAALDRRIKRLAAQVERLSYIVELMDFEPNIGLEEAEQQWLYANAKR